MSIREHVMKMKEASPAMASLPSEVRNAALRSVQEALSAHREEIFAANREDLKKAEETGISAAVVKRLRFDEHKLADVLAGIDGLIGLEDPVGRVTLRRELDLFANVRPVKV